MASRADSQIPEALVENAKALFAIRRLERPPQLPRIVAKLVYDSFHDPLPQGVRSSQRTSRQAFYEAGDYCLDLRLEVEPDQREFSLVGQIANRKRPSEHMADIPVFLLSGEDVLASTSSSQFGEFHMEHSYQRTLRLCLPILTPGKLIEVPLSRLLTGGSTGKQKD